MFSKIIRTSSHDRDEPHFSVDQDLVRRSSTCSQYVRRSSSQSTYALAGYTFLELWFQQDGATCHTADVTIDLSKDMFGDRLISRFEPVNWPPRSCDLTPLY
ncbi:hypothetical protein TNCV_209101 [Trichonephila clavipes]|uniref:Uncharacterized protein n=1 Tax=Trichonephila clavipes TaxID=2585209 RepID=A0A8X6SZ32_TRICX|nr:hypothetical protein TNCV_209101 [Trichonephila clavipes]